MHYLNDNEYYIGDGGYWDGNQWIVMPKGRNSYKDRQMLAIWSRHKSINMRIKEWNILSKQFWHPLPKHSLAFCAVANITQLGLQTDSPVFQVHYDESEF